ncbi:acid sphingomyelinase-like phosphodiesterase 3b isoform X2 [Anneissia japonica]|uniref:acid sphingomyelinase-like phosphodiesterase 3b isoform X2 n=1 Tax=Anneissia japonica TaxID=1529436 RepID=UPI0014254EAB|nr:acid sphingomyelinase-like phosphodiesterase 3b isoform X2 [Anneissia japonica]
MTASTWIIVSTVVQIVVCGPYRSSENAGKFWHVTDFHYDQFYGNGIYPLSSCRDTIENGDTRQPEALGDYDCDSPWTLVNASVYAMQTIEPNPDFIIWTGDDTPHVPNSMLNEDKVLSTIFNITELLMDAFPNTKFIPVFGNHDYHPKHQMPPNPTAFYSNVTDLWQPWLDQFPGATDLFREKTYYTAKIEPYRFVGLNTVFYYTNNKLTMDISDPAGQFSWLEQVLTDARRDNETVVIVGHVPPGCFERSRGKCWFYPEFNAQYIEVIQQFHDVIAFQLFAHQHDDSFRLFYDDEGKAISSLFLAPAVTPWNTSLAGVGPNNPSVRLFTFNREDGLLMNWEQYYLDLSEVDSADSSMWKREYSAIKDYDIPDVTTASLQSLVNGFETSDVLFNRYYLFNSVSYNTQPCTDECKITQLCSINQVDFTKFDKCVENSDDPNGTIRLHISWDVCLVGLIIAVWSTYCIGYLFN